MKYKKILLMLSIATFSLSGCKKSEPIDQSVTTTTIETTIDETTPAETTVAETTVAEITADETITDETAVSEIDTISRLGLPGNVTITEWGTNQYTGEKQALKCDYSDEWLEAVQDVINTLQEGYIETLSLE